MFKSEEFVQKLIDSGFDFFTGVPCSIIGNVINNLTERHDVTYVPAVREDAAVGVASGAYMAGKMPVVLMQNSGLGQCLNTLTSLNLIYKLPCLLIVTWRGFEGKDAPEHLVMGRTCAKLLDLVEIPYFTFNPDNIRSFINHAHNLIVENSGPVALFLKKGVID
ncbi:thiamine-pyrophosphate-binding protein [Candidatus Scalindua japonica]|uniref:Thiamine-pyrophosphate-binding protein n=1 Tax=Candidatus Scalindua japonica TaxID=1284222 RepID=A0A286TYF0_9BACT|nr:thiamine pyrophosphate-binding protein [Candidatus Scalindua japonica]GAX60894.1 thiamine-pyrophosphate-binding protein [Candidatus Scalindua japonica]